tara:strand:+ start:1751 stop:3673 length:1923 start_codon:yes stop_codon:yes gene_type:complete
MPKFEVMIGNKGVKKYEAPNKAAAYKLAVKDNCKEGDVNFMKMTEAVITKEILPIFKSFDFNGVNYVAQTLMLFYNANNDPDIKEISTEILEDGFDDDDRSLDDILNEFFVKNKTKAIAKFKKNMFTMLRSGVFYLRFLNDPQVLFCTKEEVVNGVVDLVGMVPQSATKASGGGAFLREGALDNLKKFNGSILPILSYDRKKIASYEEYKEVFLNIYYTFAYKANYTNTAEAEDVFLKIADPLPEEEEAGGKEGQDEDESEYDEDDLVSWIWKGKDYEVDKTNAKVYREDEDGELEFVGFRKLREVSVKDKKGKTKTKEEFYIAPPEGGWAKPIILAETEDTEAKAKIKELEERIDEYANQDTDRNTDLNSEEFSEEGKEVLKDEIEIRGFTFTLEDVEELPDDQQLAIYDLSQLLYILEDLSIDGDFSGGRILIGTAFRNIVLPIAEQFIILQGEATNDEERMEKIRRLEERIKELETQLLEQINSKPVEVAEEPKSDFADVSKLLQEIADLTEAREKERGEIVKVQKLEVQVESLNRMIDNLVEERDEYAVSVVELEDKLLEKPSKEVEEEEEVNTDNFDALESILKSLGVDVDELLEAIKEEDDIFDFYETPAYTRLVLRPVDEEIESKEFDREDDD